MSETINDIRAYCEGYCGTNKSPEYAPMVDDEINERLAQLTIANAQIAEIEQERLSQSKKLRDMDRICDELQAHNAVMREVLTDVLKTTVEPRGMHRRIKSALKSTTSEALEKSKRKDEVIKRLIFSLADIECVAGSAIEAAKNLVK